METNHGDMEAPNPGEEHYVGGQSECDMQISPDGTKLWLPTSKDEHTPYLGQRFETVEQGIQFYRTYATTVGFDVRNSTMRKTRDGEVGIKYMVCSREGFKPMTKRKSVNTEVGSGIEAKKRRRVTNRVGCKARMVMTRSPKGGYQVHAVELRHTHCLCSDVARSFLKINRKLDIGHKTFLANCARANIGPTKAFRLYKEMVGSFMDIGATCIDFCNFRRDLLAYIAGADAQMVVEDMFKKKEINPDFYFDFDVDEGSQLCRLFWADAVSRKNFACFGDVMSFDATYRTNRYNLVFVPFTGVDNHKRCITFGAGVIAKEDVESYEWLLKRFITAMGNTPRCSITDQDPALKIAVPKIMPTTRHRFCMWHIMTKLGDKVGNEMAKNQEFRKAINSTVWDETLSVAEFEIKWAKVMEDYNLGEHRWFIQLYEARASWIPAYFNDIFMGGLLKTTSRSEAENSYFGKFTNHHCSLVEFFMQYNSAIEEQRYKQAKLNAETEGSFPETKTPLTIERQAAAMYTIQIFYDFQTEIWESNFTCHITNKITTEGVWTYTVHEKGGKGYEVTRYENDGKIECSCKKFNRMGILCRHVLLVFKEEGIEEIPGCYIVPRWTRGAYARPMYDVPWATGTNIQAETAARTIANQLWNEFYNCLSLVNGWPEKMGKMLATLQQLKGEMQKAKHQTNPSSSNQTIFETMLGATAPGEIHIKAPRVAKNKCSGKRLKSTKEKALTKNKKKGRTCATCGGVGHDTRNCSEKLISAED